MSSIVHLTHTGYHAGTPLGADCVRESREDGAHWTFLSDETIRSGRFADGRTICPACQAVAVAVIDEPLEDDGELW